MRKKITAKQFYQAWMEAVIDRKEYLLSRWRSNAQYTLAIKGDEDCVMIAVAEKLKLKCYNRDYYAIDTILYAEEDLVPDRAPGNYWFRDIRVAFEHENHFNSGLYQEVSHLLITHCDLRVLVAYPNNDTQEKNELDYLLKIIKGNRSSQSISDSESFLIIFGYENGFAWQGLVFKEHGWKLIKAGNSQPSLIP